MRFNLFVFIGVFNFEIRAGLVGDLNSFKTSAVTSRWLQFAVLCPSVGMIESPRYSVRTLTTGFMHKGVLLRLFCYREKDKKRSHPRLLSDGTGSRGRG